MNQPENNHVAQDSSEYSEEWLSAYIDDELTEARRAIVEQRLASDSETQQLLDDLQRVRGLVNQLPAWSGKLISDGANFNATTGAAQPTQQTSLESFAHAGQRRSASWLRPLALAACLLILLGGGVWFLNSGSSWTVATSTGGGYHLQDAPLSAAATSMNAEDEADNVAELAKSFGSPRAAAMKAEVKADNSQEPPTAAANSSHESLPNPFDANDSLPSATRLESTASRVSGDASDLASLPPADEARNALGMSPPPAPAAALSLGAIAGKQAPIAASEPPQQPPPTSPLAMRDYGSSATAEGSLDTAEGSLDVEAQALGRSSQDKANIKVQIAHSPSWSANDIDAALERLALLLNLPTPQPSDPAIANSAAAIPIAIVTLKPPTAESASHGNILLREQAVRLQEVVPADARRLAWQAPFAKSLVGQPSTVALFVLRDEAEQILQAAQQAGELANTPVWISSASGTSTPASPKQQVVLLFAPQ